MDTHSRAAIVTGGTKGIGAQIARRLAADGIAVAVNYARDGAAAAAVVAEITAGGGRAIAVEADLGDPAGAAAIFDAAERAFGRIDILVNNAGTMTLSPLADASDEEFDRQVAVNLGGVFRGLREGARRLADGGRIISLSSTLVGVYFPTYGIYAATKA
ncbi:MAG: SDR family NAD(P)-dependent oxidoreductase, partial [Rhodospirillaceae bacterium]|nr:SDR family NAD(P)-dependent oxidoreductase [Rhodospirillaceae bacterium]